MPRQIWTGDNCLLRIGQIYFNDLTTATHYWQVNISLSRIIPPTRAAFRLSKSLGSKFSLWQTVQTKSGPLEIFWWQLHIPDKLRGWPAGKVVQCYETTVLGHFTDKLHLVIISPVGTRGAIYRPSYYRLCKTIWGNRICLWILNTKLIQVSAFLRTEQNRIEYSLPFACRRKKFVLNLHDI